MRSSRPSYGWVIVAVSFILLVGSFGTQLCFGLFLKPLAEEFGWSRAAVSVAMSLLMAVSGLMGVAMGRVTDRWGPRAAIAPGVFIGAASFVLMSRIDSLWQFYVLFGVGGGILAGCGYTPSVTTVSKWFDAGRRTMAIGVALLGIIVGQMVLSPVIAGVIEGSGTGFTIRSLEGDPRHGCGIPALWSFMGHDREGRHHPKRHGGIGDHAGLWPRHGAGPFFARPFRIADIRPVAPCR